MSRESVVGEGAVMFLLRTHGERMPAQARSLWPTIARSSRLGRDHGGRPLGGSGAFRRHSALQLRSQSSVVPLRRPSPMFSRLLLADGPHSSRPSCLSRRSPSYLYRYGCARQLLRSFVDGFKTLRKHPA
jgi:hypothetical protein